LTSRALPPEQTAGESPRASAARPLRIAVVGGGKMGQHHMRAIQRLGHRGQIVAVVDPSPAARDAIKAIVPDAATYPSLIEMVAQQEIDVVHVATAPHTHEELATLALEAGCNVYVEKPPAQPSGC
jgi:predicted dehydrogenase